MRLFKKEAAQNGSFTAVPASRHEFNIVRGPRREKIVMAAIQRRRRERWRRTKSRCKVEKPAKVSGHKMPEHSDLTNGEPPDRLVLSALKYWEVKRDLIEERLTRL